MNPLRGATALLVAVLMVASAPPPGAPQGAGAELAGVSEVHGLDFRPPTDGPLLRLFDPPVVRWGRGHRGVDLAATDLVVRSPGEGVVTFSDVVVNRGVVTIAHPNGLRSSFEPVDDGPPVGTVVSPGDDLGRVGAAAHCPGRPCVHWGVRRGEDYIDPLTLLDAVTVVLLPGQ